MKHKKQKHLYLISIRMCYLSQRGFIREVGFWIGFVDTSLLNINQKYEGCKENHQKRIGETGRIIGSMYCFGKKQRRGEDRSKSEDHQVLFCESTLLGKAVFSKSAPLGQKIFETYLQLVNFTIAMVKSTCYGKMFYNIVFKNTRTAPSPSSAPVQNLIRAPVML